MDPVTAMLEAIEHADLDGLDVFGADMVFDATVPDWRFTVRGAEAVKRQLASWFDRPGRFEEVHRTPLPHGELVEYLFTWEEHGVPHAVHQVHIVTISDGCIVRDVMFCGGRWPARLLAEMEAAAKS